MKRIQRKRIKGWKMPENTVYVGRPTKWGNPLRLIGDMIYIDASYRRKVLDPWVYCCAGDIETLMIIYNSLWDENVKFENPDMKYWADHIRSLNLEELKGKDLACWCPFDQPCHADVLIEKVNNL